MTQLGELAFTSGVKSLDGKCPFCAADSTADEKLEIENDSSELGDHIEDQYKELNFRISANGFGVGHRFRLATATVEESYEISADASAAEVVGEYSLNAHHIIPGNASFREVPELHQYMAATVEVYSCRYRKLRHHAKAARFKKVHTHRVGAARVTVTSRAAPSRTGLEKREKLVTTTCAGRKGKVNYDINEAANGVWLPSNYAIANWSSLAEADRLAFAKMAMKKFKVQFHDAHPNYSISVAEEMRFIVKKIDDAAHRCQDGDCGGKGGNHLQVATYIPKILSRLARLIKTHRLTARKSRAFDEKWLTSRLAQGFRLK
ncbi:hypothetical protein RA210_U30090 [Rubrivivax sp. A210]|uniref:AHH domain-containing protein n=1 Tax=Rubrivivax sp. A210 TaxID=2772301 RepID=UPI00191A3D77|nr:AHH domain-containing protein [Rubrivivax sp. A210]CAD5373178.1 hypothetical protein RA210_U30090 [Rubrivivax sp. A210]